MCMKAATKKGKWMDRESSHMPLEQSMKETTRMVRNATLSMYVMYECMYMCGCFFPQLTWLWLRSEVCMYLWMYVCIYCMCCQYVSWKENIPSACTLSNVCMGWLHGRYEKRAGHHSALERRLLRRSVEGWHEVQRRIQTQERIHVHSGYSRTRFFLTNLSFVMQKKGCMFCIET